MNHRAIMLFVVGIATAGLSMAAAARAEASRAGALVAFEFLDDEGRALETYPVATREDDSSRAYLEAVPQGRYSIRVRNLTGGRVGVVIAVDGRNIVSGSRSELARGEAMYVLGPHETADYAGWRTSTSEVRRFYFTDVPDSYASRVGDESAMGVIAAAAFAEHMQRPPGRQRHADAAPSAPRAEAESSELAESRAAAGTQAGTGFGEAAESHAIRVAFTPARQPGQRVFYKYEWAEQLCARGLGRCAPQNRFWPEPMRFVPFPPGKRG